MNTILMPVFAETPTHKNALDAIHGAGRVPYDPCGCTPLDAPPLGRGWVLPGGGRTLDKARAMHVASQIDALIYASVRPL
jgi:hypothetical protein